MSLALPGAAGAYGALNGYWGQTSYGPRLRDYCDSGVQYATLGFVNMAPENDRTGAGYPSIDFSSHCWSETFETESGGKSPLYTNCETLKEDIPYCQSKGVKVLLSIGGTYHEPTNSTDKSNDYKVTTDANGEKFAEFLYGAFGPYRLGHTGPRPFDSPGRHVAVDGFDFDIEMYFNNDPYIAMIDRFRALDRNLLITGAPQCPTNPEYFQMKGMVQKAAFDALFIQFYNNPSCNANSESGINLDDWVKVVSESEKSQNAKLFVGLIADDKADLGYIGPKEVQDLVCKYKDIKNWGGISLWDLSRADANIIDGKNYYQHVRDALKSGCNPAPTSTQSASTSSKPSSLPTGTTSTIPTSTRSASTSSKPSSSPTGSTGPIPVSASTGGSANKSMPAITSSLKWSNSTMTSASSVPMTTSNVHATPTQIISPCGPNAVDCHKGKVSTETVSLYPTARPEKPATSALYTTKTYTITSCPPQVSNCPHRKVVTQILSRVTASPDSSKAAATVPAIQITSIAPASSTLERLPKPSPAQSKLDCAAGHSVSQVPGNGRPGVNGTAGEPVSSGRLSSTAFKPSAVPAQPSVVSSVPVVAGASSLAMSLAGLVAVAAAQAVALY